MEAPGLCTCALTLSLPHTRTHTQSVLWLVLHNYTSDICCDSLTSLPPSLSVGQRGLMTLQCCKQRVQFPFSSASVRETDTGGDVCIDQTVSVVEQLFWLLARGQKLMIVKQHNSYFLVTRAEEFNTVVSNSGVHFFL